MTSPLDLLTPKISAAIEAVLGREYAGADPVVRPSQFADVQINAALALAKKVGRNPRELATQLVENLDLAKECSQIEVSGPGFINLTFADAWLQELTATVAADDALGIPDVAAERIVLDYSSPNIAKEMHVGHLRTTVVGDSLARTLEALGHTVIRQNHIGDWGTNFGMLIEHLIDVGEDSETAKLLATNPNAFYQGAREKFDNDEDFATRSRARVVQLQAGDADTLRLWHELIELSKQYLHRVYGLLGVTLTDDDLAGESTYNDDLPVVCAELEEMGIAVISDGALCVFLEGFTGRDDKPLPLIVRKSDGGYGYATTDLAMVRECVRELKADRIVYVVGAPQATHFKQVWATARKAGWLPETTTPTHVQIGNVLGEDRKLLRTRAGQSLRLMMLLEEAVDAAAMVINEARPDLSEEERAVISRQVGIGAVKYADLSVAHDSEYVFDLERMVSLVGNTGPYLQYATARIRSIFRQIGMDPSEYSAPIVLGAPEERDLALRILGFGDVVAQVGEAYEPHRLAAYLFELAQTFTAFYSNCPVLKADSDETRASRLALCALTWRVLTRGLDLLGIEAPEQM